MRFWGRWKPWVVVWNVTKTQINTIAISDGIENLSKTFVIIGLLFHWHLVRNFLLYKFSIFANARTISYNLRIGNLRVIVFAQKLGSLWVQELKLYSGLSGLSKTSEDSLVWSSWPNWHDGFLTCNRDYRNADVDICGTDDCRWRAACPFRYHDVRTVKVLVWSCLFLHRYCSQFILLRNPGHNSV